MSPETQKLFSEMARVLEYPNAGYAEHVQACSHLLSDRGKNNGFERFREFVALARQDVLEEIYVQTFDVQSICCLDVGYVMFGEDYRRGQFMAQLKMLEKDRGVDCGTELPDFLPNLLRLLGFLKKGESKELVEAIVAPAIDKMLEGFKENGNVYREPLQSLREILREDYGS